MCYIKPVIGFDASSGGYTKCGERMLMIEVDIDRPVADCPIDYKERADKTEAELRSLARSLLDKGATKEQIEQAFNTYQFEGVCVTLHAFTLFEGESLLTSDLLTA